MAGATGPSPESLRVEKEARELVAQAREARKRGDIAGAQTLYTRSYELRDDALVRLELIEALDGARRTKAALREYDALFDNPSLGGSYRTSATVLGRYAALCEGAGRTAEATDLYRRIVSAYRPGHGYVPPAPPTDVRDLVTLKATAKILEGFGHARHAADKEALVCLKEAVRIKPDFPLAHLYVAACSESVGDWPGAEAAYRRAYAIGDASIRRMIGEMNSEILARIERSPPSAALPRRAASRGSGVKR